MQQRRTARFSKSVDAENFLNLFSVPRLLCLRKRRRAVADRTFAYEAVVRVGPSDALGLEPVDIFPHPIERAPSRDLEQVLYTKHDVSLIAHTVIKINLPGR